MSTFPGTPRVLRAGIVLADPGTLVVQRVITMQYNPDTLSRTLQARSVAAEGGDRLEALRLTGPPIETIKLDAEIDATDQLEHADKNPTTVQYGIQPQLAALEMLVYPSSSQIVNEDNLAQAGTIEVAPVEAPLALFVWSATRIVPVRVTDFSITEEAFDVNLNPIRAKVGLSMRVLNVNDLQFDEKGNSIFMAYHQQKERLASMTGMSSLASLGISSIGG
jgi:hypothetical protein